MQKPLRRHKIGRKASLSSVMLQAPTLMADFEPRNRRGIEEKMMCTALPFFFCYFPELQKEQGKWDMNWLLWFVLAIRQGPGGRCTY